MDHNEIKDPFRRFVRIMERLQEPGGCAWDLEQTHESLRQYMIEECYEALDAIDRNDYEHLAEELGDVLIQVVFHSVLAARLGRFNIDRVITEASEKMVRRHPHVFGEEQAETSSDVLQHWDRLKAEERKKKGKEQDAFKPLLSGIPAQLPSLLKAQRMQEKSPRHGVELQADPEALLQKMKSISAEDAKADPKSAQSVLGDLLFALTDLARQLGINAEEALRQRAEEFRVDYSAQELKEHSPEKP